MTEGHTDRHRKDTELALNRLTEVIFENFRSKFKDLPIYTHYWSLRGQKTRGERGILLHTLKGTSGNFLLKNSVRNFFGAEEIKS